jgi:hypothetical protein
MYIKRKHTHRQPIKINSPFRAAFHVALPHSPVGLCPQIIGTKGVAGCELNSIVAVDLCTEPQTITP